MTYKFDYGAMTFQHMMNYLAGRITAGGARSHWPVWDVSEWEG